MRIRRACLMIAAAVTIVLIAVACSAPATPPPPTPEPCPTCPAPEECPECEACPEAVECPAGVEAPFESDWLTSGHADAAAEAFVHWDEEDPAVVPEACAKCHSTYGYQDFLGADGSAAWVVDGPAEIGSTVTCVACHNDATVALTSVVFPSGLELTGLGDEARCMQCHQGRASTQTVNASIEEAGVADMDVVSEDLGFTNIHYFAAAATQYGTQAMGGYEYDGKSYDPKFAHAGGLDTCIDCHQPHTLEIRVETCSECHEGVAAVEDLKDVRTQGSKTDYDGDGDIEEGIYYELEGLRDKLYAAMQAYSADVNGTAIAYDAAAYPYFFNDTNANGTTDADEANFGNQYAGWTGRLAKAAYNYQTSLKDPGAFAHGGKYVIELLYDSIEDLNGALADPVDLSSAHRVDAGHFAASEDPWRHWDADGEVSSRCAKCHSAGGLPTFLEEGVNVTEEISSGLACITCHDPATEDFAPRTVETVRFPSGAQLNSGSAASNVCLNCHQGRESGASVAGDIEGFGDDEIIADQGFINVHYFAAGATLMGADAAGAYLYPDQTYLGQLEHVEGAETCVDCHDPHGLVIEAAFCETCHRTDDPRTIRMSDSDYDGDGDTDEGLAAEIATLEELLFTTMQDYAAGVLETPIMYDSASHPYFFNDLNGNGEADADEVARDNAYANWTPRLLKAAYNYQYVHKDPGAFAHNGAYILQVLYDTLADLGEQVDIDMTAMVRPVAETE